MSTCARESRTSFAGGAARYGGSKSFAANSFHIGGHVAFEVGEVHGGKTKLEETVLPCGVAAGLEPVLVLINDQKFTKTANCWGVDNNAKGTNTNRIVLFRKPA